MLLRCHFTILYCNQPDSELSIAFEIIGFEYKQNVFFLEIYSYIIESNKINKLTVTFNQKNKEEKI